MSRDEDDRELYALVRLILADAEARNVLRPDGRAKRCSYSTVLVEGVPAMVTLSSFFPPRSAGDMPPEAYLQFVLSPDGSSPRPKGYFNVAFRVDRGWMLYGDQEYRRDAGRSAELTRLIRRARP